ncbi:MAG: hypothetical protein OXC30_02845 [Alphaproteobacteria bacterium]|nr:hypothetical protein [Alphaproteobacteria bacterium]
MKNFYKYLSRILQFVFVCGLFICIIYFSITRPRVLVIQSYDLDYSWTVDVEKAIKRVFKAHPNILVHYTYMNTKNNKSSEYLRKAGAAVDGLIAQVHPNVLLLVDDNAQRYVGMRYRHDPNISVVFAGVNADLSAYGYHEKGANVTGILERIPLDQTQHILQFFQKNDKPMKIFVLGDKSTTVSHDAKMVQDFDWAPHKVEEARLCQTFQEWQEAILEFSKCENGVILVTNYQQLIDAEDPSGQFVEPQDVMAWTTQHSALPTIGNNGFVVQDGGGFAVATSPYEQGEMAALKAVEVASGSKKAMNVPISSTNLFMIYMNGTILKKHGFQLPRVYKAFAKVTNTYYESAP